jgi:delta14-sterol reductase
MNGQFFARLVFPCSSRVDSPLPVAFSTMMLTLAIIGGYTAVKGIDALLYIPHHFPQLVSAALAMSFFQACFVYAQSYAGEQMLAEGGNSSNPLYNVRSPL